VRVDRVRLQNFKCYGDADLSLERGVTVVHGINGSGKSTLLEAVFFALYGSKALDDRTLDDVITTGEEEAEVELWFTHDNREYHVERRLKLRGDRATTTKCVLETPTETLEGARDVRREVTELLRMDSSAFVNCAYVRQGEVNKLIHASPSDRQDMIDDLLQLGALEEYRERASDARLGVKTVLDGQREVADNLRQQIETKENEELHERLNGLESRQTEIREEIAHFETQREQARKTRETATEVLKRHEETREEIDRLETEIAELRSKISDTERERKEATERIRELEDEREELGEQRQELLADGDLPVATGAETEVVSDAIADLEDRDDQLRDDLEEAKVAITETTGDIERLRETITEREQTATEAREEAAALAERIETDTEEIDERERKLAELEDRIETERERFADTAVAFGEASKRLEELEADRQQLTDEIGTVTADVRAVKNAIEDGERLLDAGKCPECGQPVEDSPHVDVLEEKREQLDTLETRLEEIDGKRETIDERLEQLERLREAERQVEHLEENRRNVAQLLEEKRDALADRRDQRETVLETAETAAIEADAKRDRIEDLEDDLADHRHTLGEINTERSTIRDHLASLRRVLEIDDRRATLSREIDAARERRENWRTMNDERRETLSGKRERKRDLEEEFDDERVETARTDKHNAETYLKKVDEKLEDLDETLTEVQNAIGATRRELEELEELEKRYETLEARCDRLESLYAEAETLQTTYGSLRSELRQHNVETLERLLNETFELVYQNDSYASIELDGEYRLTVYQKDGETLEPEQLSGGERALFNLSLRCAIYRLLAEGVEGTAPMPPLILDEPTVFLDSGHVTQLVSLVESMRDLGVEQIVVVSHDEELVGAADSLVRVEKNSTSNRSRIERGEPPDAALVSSG